MLPSVVTDRRLNISLAAVYNVTNASFSLATADERVAVCKVKLCVTFPLSLKKKTNKTKH